MLPLAFAGILAGTLSVLAGISGHSYSEVIKGETQPFIGLLKGPSDPAVTGGPQLPEPSLTNTRPESAAPGSAPSPTTFSKASGLALYYAQTKKELEAHLKRRLSKKEEAELRTYARESYKRPSKQVKVVQHRRKSVRRKTRR